MDMHMVDNEANRNDRKEQAGDDQKPEMSHLPNRRQRRLIAKQRGVFKTPGAWPYINTRAMSNKPKRRQP